MINITISSKTSLFHMAKELQEDINHNMIEIETQVDDIANQAVDYMRQFITSHLVRSGSTGNLIRNINLYQEGTRAGTGQSFWGIGSIDELNDNAPYWHLCLSETTEVYVQIANKIVPMVLKDVCKHQRFVKGICTPYGIRPINKIIKTNPSEIRKITLSQYEPIICSKDHLFVSKLNQRLLEKNPEQLNKKTVGSNYLLYSSLKSLNESSLVDKLNIYGDNIALDFNLGYLIGFIAGDGCISLDKKRVSITQVKLDNILPQVQQFCSLFAYQPNVYHEENAYSGIYRIQIDKQHIANIFSYFIEGKKTNKKFKHFFLNTNVDFRLGILAGYKESDGRKKMVNSDQIRSISKTLRNQVLLIASSLGYDISYLSNQESWFDNKRNNDLLVGSYYKTRKFLGKWKIGNKVYKGEKAKNKLGQFCSQEYKVYEDFSYKNKKIVKIEPIAKVEDFYDLSVNGELFLINGGIISHNCNFGGMSLPAQVGMGVPGLFNGERADPTKSGTGVGGERFQWAWKTGMMFPKFPVVGINYIENTEFFLEQQINTLLMSSGSTSSVASKSSGIFSSQRHGWGKGSGGAR